MQWCPPHNYNEVQKVLVCNVVIVILFVWMDPGVMDLYSVPLREHGCWGKAGVDVSAGRVELHPHRIAPKGWNIFLAPAGSFYPAGP